MTDDNKNGDDQALFFEDKIDFLRLILILWEERWLVVSGTFLSGVLSIIISLSIANVFTSSALLAPKEANDGAGGLAQLSNQFEGLAGFAGVAIFMSSVVS